MEGTSSSRASSGEEAPSASVFPSESLLSVDFEIISSIQDVSASAWEALGCSYEAALVLLDGDEAALRRALASFTQLGARPAAAIATRRLREQGVRAIPRGPHGSTRANPAQLTGRELEILPLLAAGERDAEIAQRLYLSPKTVGHHVGHILAKLGVHARSEVGPAAARLGLPFTPPEN